jgi:hypothetical protein
MLQAVEYCKCGTELSYITIILKQSDTESIGERKPVCYNCLEPIEIDLRKWGIKSEV